MLQIPWKMRGSNSKMLQYSWNGSFQHQNAANCRENGQNSRSQKQIPKRKKKHHSQNNSGPLFPFKSWSWTIFRKFLDGRAFTKHVIYGPQRPMGPPKIRGPGCSTFVVRRVAGWSFLDGFWMFVGLCCFYLRVGADTWQNTSTQLILPKFPSFFFQRPQRWDCGKNISFNMNQLSGLRLLSVAWAIWEEELLCARRLCLWRPWDGSKVFGHSWALRNHRYHRSRAFQGIGNILKFSFWYTVFEMNRN